MASKIETQILEKTQVQPQQDGEQFQVYLRRCVDGVSNLDEKGWASLDTATQQWYNDAAAAVTAKKPIQNFPDETGTATAAPTPRATKIPTNAAPAAAASAEAPATTAAAASTAAPAATAATSGKKKGGVAALKRLIISNPAAEKDALSAALVSEGYEIGKSTFESVVYDMKQTMALLEEMGRLKPAAD